MPPSSEQELLSIDLEAQCGFLLVRTAQALERTIEQALTGLDLTRTQFYVLSVAQHLSRRDAPVTQSAIAQRSGLDLMMVSQVSRRLVEKGFLVREPHPTDQRAKAITLTDSGCQAVVAARSRVMTASQEFFALAGKHREALFTGLDALYQQARAAGCLS